MVVRLPEMKKYLNRDGLEEYNSLLPHSSTEIEEYVADWLDAHPEATTTVQDGSITTQKLANASVTRNKLAADVAHLLGGMMLTKDVQGEILSASDAYFVAPLSMTVDGKSTQDGTPTPESPVPINSIEVLELPIKFEGKNLLQSLYDTEFTSYGITWKFDEQGRFWNKTGSAATSTRTVQFRTYDDIEWPAGDYVFCWTQVPSTSYGQTKGPTLHLIDADGNTRVLRDGSRPKIPFTLAEGERPDYFAFAIGSGSTYANIIFSPMVYRAGEDSTWEPYKKKIANIPMQGNVLRSLPDGTHDIMSLSYLHESDRTGWAWYSAELMQAVGIVDMGTLEPREISSESPVWYLPISNSAKGLTNTDKCLCTGYLHVPSHPNSNGMAANAPDKSCELQNGQSRLFIKDSDLVGVSAADVTAIISGMTAIYPLDIPITTQLDPIELPVLPAPNCTIWSDPATGLKMSYMRDSNIVISDIEQAIADQ